MEIRKSDKSLEEYSKDKVKNVICEAYTSAGEECDETLIDSIVNNLFIYDGMSTNEIRRQVEFALMSINKKVAKAFLVKNVEREAVNKTIKKTDDFISNYFKASNAATGSKYDSNANVSNKNVVTMGQELPKSRNIEQNRYMITDRLRKKYSKKLAKQYLEDLEHHILYKHDETAIPGMPYCVAITMYPFLVDGLTKLGGQSVAPTDLKSFCGEFINLVYSVSSQFAGAVATPEFLMYMDYFIRKDYGDDYLTILDKVVELNKKGRTLEGVIENYFQQVVHSMNMPAGNRGYQTVFWNVGYFDKNYFEGVFGDFMFPDGTKPKWETLSWLQKKFMNWFNEERTKYVLTFPVETMALLSDGHDIVDKEYGEFTAEMWAKGASFFCYISDSPDSLSSCCRLRNSLKDNQDTEHNHTTHQFSMGTASVATGSKSVMTVNLNRLIQDAVNKYAHSKGVDIPKGFAYPLTGDALLESYAFIKKDLTDLIERVHKYQTAFNDIIREFYENNMLDVYSAGFIDMKKQYLTIGVNGLTDAAEFLGIEISDNETYNGFVNLILETINKLNRKNKTRDLMFNTEFVPGENLSKKNYTWDEKDGYFVSKKHNMYSSYFYNPEDKNVSILEKMRLHGKRYVEMLDGGSALHANLKEHLSKEQYQQLLRVACENGTNYFTFNVKNTRCKDCGHISKHTLDTCPRCGSKNLSYLTRIIGYLKEVNSFSEPRQEEESVRYYE